MSTLTVQDVAAELACSEDKVREALNTGDIPGVKYGRDWVIPAEAMHRRLVEKALDDAAARRATKPTTLEIVQAVVQRRRARVPPVLG